MKVKKQTRKSISILQLRFSRLSIREWDSLVMDTSW
jgi:hypothetical protein